MDEQRQKAAPLLLFYSYASEDEPLQQLLEKHLAILQRQGIVHFWQKRQIEPGADWTALIDQYLKKADIFLLLVSPDYLASDYCYGIEMQRVLELHEAHKTPVIPILLRPVEWRDAPFGHLQYLPHNARPVTLWKNRDQAFSAIAGALRDIFQELSKRTHLLHEATEHLSLLEQTASPPTKKPVFFLPLSLPDLYVNRLSPLERLREFLLGAMPVTVVTAVIHGMGGLGKTVLARAACDDLLLRDAFPDGILWATVGQNPRSNSSHPHVQEIQSNWITILGGNSSAASNETQGKVELQRLLEDRAMLLVLDDVWDRQDIEFLLIKTQRCRILITTRDRAIVEQAAVLPLDVMSLEESRELLKTASHGKIQDVALADAIAEHLGYLPLALDIVARLLAEEIRWEEIEEALASNLTEIGYSQKTLATLVASVSFLQSGEQERYHELVVFPQDEKIPRSAVAKLWKHAGLSAYQTSNLLAKFRQRALLQDSNTLHDLHYYYVQGALSLEEQQTLHNRLIEVYGGPAAWERFPENDDFYIWRRLAYHLDRASRLSELKALLTDGEYLKAKFSRVGVADTLIDYGYLPLDQRLSLLVTALQLGAFVLNHDPEQLRNQLYGRLGTLTDLQHLRERKPAFLLDSRTLTWPDAPPLSTFPGHKGSVFGCALSPDGQQVLSASADRSLRLWERETGKTLLTLEGHQGTVNDCVFTPDGSAFISASDDATVRIWDVHAARPAQILHGHQGSVKSCVLSPDRFRVLSASSDGSLRLWNKETLQCLHIFQGHQGGVNCCAFHPDGRHIASGADDHTIRIWNSTTGEALSLLAGHSRRVLSCSFSPDGRWLASSSEDKTIRVWDLSSGQAVHVLEGHTDFVHCCVFSPNSDEILSASSDYTLRLWNAVTGQFKSIWRGHESWVNRCCFASDGQRALSASYDGSLRLWDVAEGKTIRLFAGDIGYLRDCALSPDGKYAVSAQANGSLQVWDTYRRRAMHVFKGHRGYASSCAFSSDGAYLLSGSADASLRLWKMATGETIREFRGHEGHIYHCALSPDGTWAISASADATVRLWHVPTGEVQGIFTGHGGMVRGCAFSPDGKFVLSSSWDNTLRLWDITKGQTVQEFHGHLNHVRGCTFSPDGEYILSASYDATLKLWSKADGTCIRTFQGHTSWVFDCAFLLEGSLFVSVADDHTLKLWRTETGEVLTSWIADAPLTCCDVNNEGQQIICGDSLGNLHFLHLLL